jgi:hypothetical protein
MGPDHAGPGPRWSVIPAIIVVAIVIGALSGCLGASRSLADTDRWADMTAAQILDGWGTHYSNGLMAEVARARGISLDGFAGGVALNRAGDLGRAVWLEFNGTVSGPYLSVDCARRGRDYVVREQKRYIVEIDYDLAQRWGVVGDPFAVRVYFEAPIGAPSEETSSKRK